MSPMTPSLMVGLPTHGFCMAPPMKCTDVLLGLGSGPAARGRRHADCAPAAHAAAAGRPGQRIPAAADGWTARLPARAGGMHSLDPGLRCSASQVYLQAARSQADASMSACRRWVAMPRLGSLELIWLYDARRLVTFLAPRCLCSFHTLLTRSQGLLRRRRHPAGRPPSRSRRRRRHSRPWRRRPRRRRRSTWCLSRTACREPRTACSQVSVG